MGVGARARAICAGFSGLLEVVRVRIERSGDATERSSLEELGVEEVRHVSTPTARGSRLRLGFLQASKSGFRDLRAHQESATGAVVGQNGTDIGLAFLSQEVGGVDVGVAQPCHHSLQIALGHPAMVPWACRRPWHLGLPDGNGRGCCWKLSEQLPGLLAGLHGRLAFQKAEGAHALTRNHWKPKHNSIYLSIYLSMHYLCKYIIYHI